MIKHFDLTLWQACSDTFSFYRRHLFAIAALVLPFAVPMSFLQGLLAQNELNADYLHYWLVVGLGLVMQPLFQGAVILYMRAQLRGNSWALGDCLRAALQVWPALFTVVVTHFILVMLGLSLFIIPGVIIASRLLFADLNCVLHRMPPYQALALSWKQTDERRWLLFGGVVLFASVSILPVWGIHQWLVNQQSGELLIFLNRLLGSMLEMLMLVFAYRVYTAMELEPGQAEPESASGSE